MQALEEKFPEPTLMPEDKAELDALMERFSKVSSIVFRTAFGPSPEPEALTQLTGFLEYAEQVAAKHKGQFLFGEFSVADIATAPFLPRLLTVPDRLHLAAYPNFVTAVEALTARPSYQQTAVDVGTLAMVAESNFGVMQDVVRAQLLSFFEFTCLKRAMLHP